MTRPLALLALLFGLAACGSDPGSRALSGGAVIGAATTPLAW